ncbi:MAG: hypothetical protein Q9159_000157 [Coniocarpon cinnabarinum]
MSIHFFGAAALLTVVARAANVNVINNCKFHVKATPSHEGADDPPEYVQPGDTFSRPANGEAWCLKLYAPSRNNGQEWTTSPTQLEWSNPSSGSTLFYDLSNIDMGSDTAFLQHGMNLSSSDPSCDHQSSNCRPAVCKPQGMGKTQPCDDAYNLPYDTRTLGANSQYDINMHLCTNNDQDSGSSSDSSGSSDSSSDSSSSNQAPSYSAPSTSQHQNSAPAYNSASQPSTTFATQPAITPAPSSYGGSGSGSNNNYGSNQGSSYGDNDGPHALAADTHGGPVSEVPAQDQGSGNMVTKYVMNTDVVTQIVTARDAEPTIAKRHMHMHHGHQRHA